VPIRPSTALTRLEKIHDRFGDGLPERKLALLRTFRRGRLRTADQLRRLHETLCFLRAYPDDRHLLKKVDQLLGEFSGRSDLRKLRDELADSGIAGTDLYFRFFYFSAGWLLQRCPRQVTIDWEDFDSAEKLEEILQFLVPYAETLGLDMLPFDVRRWLAELKNSRETDAEFLVRRFQALPADDFAREMLYESINVPLHVAPGRKTPARTLARAAWIRPVFQREPLQGARPDLREAVQQPPLNVQRVEGARARQSIDLLREAMATRHRDLYTFSHVNPDDIRLVDAGQGLQFLCFGTTPLRRLMLESTYGFLTLKNGVPIGYVLLSSLFGSSELAYNVFDTFRGAEAGPIFGRVVAMAHHLFGADAFSIDPYQLGHDNAEGLASGAWWFYYKLGFRPQAPQIKRLVKTELRKMKSRPGHRSTPATLNELSSDNMYFYLGTPRPDIMGRLELGRVGLAVSRFLARRYGAERERGIGECAAEAAKLLGLRALARLDEDERRAWERWSPLALLLPGVRRWSAADRRALAAVMRAKGARAETDFVERFDAHPRLRAALVALTKTTPLRPLRSSPARP